MAHPKLNLIVTGDNSLYSRQSFIDMKKKSTINLLHIALYG